MHSGAVLGLDLTLSLPQQDVTTLNARGLGSGETPLRRWGGYRGSVIVSVERSHRDAVATPNYRSLVKRLVLHRSVTPTGVAKYLEYSIDYCTLPTTSTQGDRRVHRGKTTSFVGEELFLLRVSCGHLESNMSTLGKSGHPESNVSTLGMSGHRAKGKEWIHNASSHAHFSDVFCQF